MVQPFHRGYIDNVSEQVLYTNGDLVECRNTTSLVPLLEYNIAPYYLSGGHAIVVRMAGRRKQNDGDQPFMATYYEDLKFRVELGSTVMFEQDGIMYTDSAQEEAFEMELTFRAQGDNSQTLFGLKRGASAPVDVGLGGFTVTPFYGIFIGSAAEDGTEALPLVISAQWTKASTDIYITRDNVEIVWV